MKHSTIKLVLVAVPWILSLFGEVSQAQVIVARLPDMPGAVSVDPSKETLLARTTAAKKADRKLGLEVRKALVTAQGIDVSNIYVQARSGIVVLSGSVPDGSQLPKAEEAAKTVAGVTSVANRLSLSPEGGGG